MENSRLSAKCHLPEAATRQSVELGANGILGRIQSQYVSAAISALPPATSLAQQHQEVDIDVGPEGRVRFFAEKIQAKHHRHSQYFWSIYRAEPIGADELP